MVGRETGERMNRSDNEQVFANIRLQRAIATDTLAGQMLSNPDIAGLITRTRAVADTILASEPHLASDALASLLLLGVRVDDDTDPAVVAASMLQRHVWGSFDLLQRQAWPTSS